VKHSVYTIEKPATACQSVFIPEFHFKPPAGSRREFY
jgi:hypothetical protein